MAQGHSTSVRRRRGWLGVVVMALGAVWLHGAGSISATTVLVGVGPSAAVYAVGAGLVLLGGCLLVQELRGTGEYELEAGASRAPDVRNLLLALAGVSIPLLTMRALGFPLTAMVSFVLVTHAFGSKRTWFDLVLGAVLGSVVWLLFSKLGIGLGAFFPPMG